MTPTTPTTPDPPSFYVLVKFLQRKTTYVVQSSEVREFTQGTRRPQHSDDFIPELVYDIFWQEGEGSFDGYFSATIICMAASLPELKEKAAEKNIKRMPPNYATLLQAASKSMSPEKEVDSKSKERTKAADGRLARKRRMQNVVEEVCSSSSKRPRGSDKTKGGRSDRKSSHSSKKAKSVKSSPAKTTTPLKLSPSKTLKPASPKFSSPQTSLPMKTSPFKACPVKPSSFTCSSPMKFNSLYSPSSSFNLTSPLKFSVDSFTENSGPGNHDSTMGERGSNDEEMESIKKNSDSESEPEAEKAGGVQVRTEEALNCNNAKQQALLNSDESDSDDSELDKTLPIYQGHDVKNSSSDSDDSTCQLMEQMEEMKKELRHAKLDIVSLKAGLKASEQLRFKLQDESNKLKLCVDKLQTKLQQYEGKGSQIYEENKKLKKLMSYARDVLNSGLESSSAAAISSTRTNGSVDSTPKSGEITPSTRVTKVLNFDESSRDKSLVKGIRPASLPSSPIKVPSVNEGSPSKRAETKTHASKSDQVKSKSKGSPDSKTPEPGLSQKKIKELSERIRKDLTGEVPLECNEAGQVTLGPGVSISKEKWKYIKGQTKNSLFIKKLATSVYGHDGLKVRTVGKSKTDPTKVVATPVKVDTFVAALRGKLLADNPSMPNVDAAAVAAKAILATKMQDEARPKKPSKSNNS